MAAKKPITPFEEAKKLIVAGYSPSNAARYLVRQHHTLSLGDATNLAIAAAALNGMDVQIPAEESAN